MDLDNRQKDILEIVVEEFIRSARPIGSEFLAENYDLKVSSATIRNDMALLEEIGFLAKPHVSGGRIPTTLGWRYFIEEVWEPNSENNGENEATRFNMLMANLVSTSAELKECASKIFPEVSDEFFKKFLMEKLFNNENKYDRRK
jgi:heat-inducible transcriptional repressor